MSVPFWRCEEAKWKSRVESQQLRNLAFLLTAPQVVSEEQTLNIHSKSKLHVTNLHTHQLSIRQIVCITVERFNALRLQSGKKRGLDDYGGLYQVEPVVDQRFHVDDLVLMISWEAALSKGYVNIVYNNSLIETLAILLL